MIMALGLVVSSALLVSLLGLRYDYFSCPQSCESNSGKEQAINCIPEYIAKCAHFMVLTPPLLSCLLFLWFIVVSSQLCLVWTMIAA